MYKSKLNELCQKKGWGYPKYSCIKDGKDHNPLFGASVVVNGFSFVSSSIFKSTKLAYDAAAELAFSHFTSSSTISQVPPAVPKNINPTTRSCSDIKKSMEIDVNKTEDTAMVTPDQSPLSINDSNPPNKAMDSYLLCNKVRVYTSIPNSALPDGTVVLPIGDNKWTIVSLE